MSTTMNTTNEAALRYLNACWTDLTAAHRHAVDAASGLTGARQHRAIELAGLVADGLVFTGRLSVVVEGDLRGRRMSERTATTLVAAGALIAATLTTLGAAIGAAVILAPHASADAGADYGTTHGAQLCAAIAENPSFDGILALPTPTLGGSIEKNDLGLAGMGEAVGTAVRDTCPQFRPLATAFGRWHSTLV
jgi:hypothetical protein